MANDKDRDPAWEWGTPEFKARQLRELHTKWSDENEKTRAEMVAIFSGDHPYADGSVADAVARYGASRDPLRVLDTMVRFLDTPSDDKFADLDAALSFVQDQAVRDLAYFRGGDGSSNAASNLVKLLEAEYWTRILRVTTGFFS